MDKIVGNRTRIYNKSSIKIGRKRKEYMMLIIASINRLRNNSLKRYMVSSLIKLNNPRKH